MQQNFTPERILQVLYRETDPQEAARLRRLMREDESLRQTCRELAQAKQMLPKVHFRPSRELRQRILAYSRHAEVGREV